MNCDRGNIQRIVVYKTSDLKIIDGKKIPKRKYGKFIRKPRVYQISQKPKGKFILENLTCNNIVIEIGKITLV